MIFNENCLPADNSHEICLICYFLKSSKILNCHLLQIVGGALRVKASYPGLGISHFRTNKLLSCYEILAIHLKCRYDISLYFIGPDERRKIAYNSDC